MKVVTAKATRAGDWWAIEVPEVPGVFTQAKRLDQVEGMARDAVAVLLDVPADGITVDLELDLASDTRAELDRIHELVTQFSKAQESASTLMRQCVVHLRDEGLTVRDVGTVLGISPQRVSQLEASARGKA